MKTHTKISTLAVVYALCAGVAMPTFAAPSVRALGGAGTYSSASSATQAKTGTASTAQKAETVRGGSLSVDSGTSSAGAKTVTNKVSGTATGIRGSSARSASVRVPSSARLSIGKYLGGASVSQPPKQCIPGEPGCDTPTPSEDFIEYDISYDEDTYRLTIYDKTNREEVMSRDVASHKALENLREDLTELEGLVGSGELDTEAVTIIAAINELVAGKQDKLIAGDGIAIDDNEISVRVGEGLDIKNGVIVTDIDAPIQKQIIQGKGIEILVGAKEDAVKVKLAEKDSNLTFDSAGGLRVDLPEGGVQEKLEAGTGISQAELDAGKIGVNILPNGEGGLIVQDGYLQTAIEFPENPQKEIAAGNGIAVLVGEDKDTVEVKLAADGGLKFDDDGSLRTSIKLPTTDLPEVVQEKLTAGTGIKIADNVISTNLRSDSTQLEIRTSETDPNVVVFNLKDVAPADGVITYKAGDGIAIDGDNGISALIGSGLRFNEDTKAIETIATLPEGGEVQAKLTAGKYINIDENNVITTTLKESDSIKIGEDGTITASVPLKEYTGGNGIDVAADGTITTKLLSSNSEQLNINYDESGNAVFTLNVPGLDGNTQYTAGAGLNLDGNEFRLSATESGMFLYTYNADTKQGSWQQVEIVDVTDVNTSSEATN